MMKLFTALLWLLPFSLFSQKTWTLQECVDHAIANNLQVKQAITNHEISKNAQTQKFFNLFPSLNASGSYSQNFGRSVDPFSYDFTNQTIKSASMSVSTGVAIFNGFQLQNELKKSKLDYLSSKYDLEKLMNDISLNVAAAYLQVLYSQELLTSAADRATLSAGLRDRTAKLVESGVLAQGSLLDAESQLSTDELSRVTAENNLNLSVLSLAQLLELEDAGGLRVEQPKVEITDQSALTLSPSEIYDMAHREKPEIKSAEYKVQSAEKSMDIARGGMYPRLRAFGSVSSGYSNQALRRDGAPIFEGPLPTGAYTQSGEAVLSDVTLYNFVQTPFGDQVDQNLSKSAGISLEIPIFNGWSVQNNIRRARLMHEYTKYGAEITRQQLRKSIQQAHADALAALNRHNAAIRNTDAMSEAFRYAEKKFDAGLVNALDMTTMQNNLAKAESDRLQAKYDFIFRLKVLDFYMGKPLTY